MLRDLNSRLGEDFMPLLPETIPFLAELMEGMLDIHHSVIHKFYLITDTGDAV